MDYLLFLGICILGTVVPGPAILLAIKDTVRYGHRNARLSIAGSVLSIITVSIAESAGLGAMILASATAFSIIKTIGGLYLIYIGIKTWKSRPKHYTEGNIIIPSLAPKKSKLFYRSYLVGLTNPRAIVFIAAVFPQFINSNEPVFFQFALLTITFTSCAFISIMLYSLMASKFTSYLKKEGSLIWFNRFAGSFFFCFGFLLISSHQ